MAQTTTKLERPVIIKDQVKRLVSCIPCVTNKFEDTGIRSPGGGIGYVDRTHDIYVNVYSGYARVFYCRKKGYSEAVMLPHIYRHEIRLDS